MGQGAAAAVAAGVGDGVVGVAVGFEDGAFLGAGGLAGVGVQGGGGHGEGGELVACVGAGEGVDEAGAVALARGVDLVGVDAVVCFDLVEQVADELDVVHALIGVAGALPGCAVGALDALGVDDDILG